MSNWNEFEEDCMRHYGKVLTGQFKHFCCEFDFLPIDETCPEFECCTCNYNDWDMKEKRKILDDLQFNRFCHEWKDVIGDLREDLKNGV